MATYSATEGEINIFAYEDWPLRYEILDEDDAVQSLVDLEAAVWILRTKTGRGTSAVEVGAEILRKELADGIEIESPDTSGFLTVVVTFDEVQDLPSGLYYFELQLTIDGTQRKVAYGDVNVAYTGIRS